MKMQDPRACLDYVVDSAAPSVLGWKHEFNKVLLSVTLQVSFNDSISQDFIPHASSSGDPR